MCPPNYNSYRTVAIPDELIEILLAHFALHTPDGAADRWLFSDDEGPPHTDNSINWRWRGTCNAAGITGFSLHDLRHFYASGLIHAGCDLITVQKALGHKSATTTLNTYAHPDAGDRTRTAASELAQQALAPQATGHKRLESHPLSPARQTFSGRIMTDQLRLLALTNHANEEYTITHSSRTTTDFPACRRFRWNRSR
ncbi:tyrosine-type recombinase/integrase [Nesterenkonia sandarakina]|uniref:tyrosine-type recombinase/integrase n=1 Tax=Nesterenkonia sandarakina TaxID=272918 RepID=UPI0031B618E5